MENKSLRNSFNQQKSGFVSEMNVLHGKLAALAPHPDRPEYRGPLFVKLSEAQKPASDNDGMLGTMILDSFLGGAFSAAAQASAPAGAASTLADGLATGSDWGTVVDMYDYYRQDRMPANDRHALGDRGKLSGSFNNLAPVSHEREDAFVRDLPARMEIERKMAFLGRSMEQMEAAPQLKAGNALPQLRFA